MSPDPVKKLSNAYFTSPPVSGGDRIIDLFSYYSRANRRYYHINPSLIPTPFQLILYVTYKIPKSSPEQICHHLTSKFDDLVSVMVLVIRLYPTKFKF